MFHSFESFEYVKLGLFTGFCLHACTKFRARKSNPIQILCILLYSGWYAYYLEYVVLFINCHLVTTYELVLNTRKFLGVYERSYYTTNSY